MPIALCACRAAVNWWQQAVGHGAKPHLDECTITVCVLCSSHQAPHLLRSDAMWLLDASTERGSRSRASMGCAPVSASKRGTALSNLLRG